MARVRVCVYYDGIGQIWAIIANMFRDEHQRPYLPQDINPMRKRPHASETNTVTITEIGMMFKSLLGQKD